MTVPEEPRCARCGHSAGIHKQGYFQGRGDILARVRENNVRWEEGPCNMDDGCYAFVPPRRTEGT